MNAPSGLWRYKVELDQALERGDESAFKRYQHQAELFERPQEEWEWARLPPPVDLALARALVPDGVFLAGAGVIYVDRRTHYRLSVLALESYAHSTLSFEYLPPNDIPGATRPTLMLAGVPVVISDYLESRVPALQPWVQVTEALESLDGDASLSIALVASDEPSLQGGRTFVLTETPFIPQAQLLPGYQIRPGVPIGPIGRYVGLRFTTAGSEVLRGRVSAGFLLTGRRGHELELAHHQSLRGPPRDIVSENSLDTRTP
jgi:hypothetical protein